MIMWKNPQWHFNVVFISFGLYLNLMLAKMEYFPVVILNRWIRFSVCLWSGKLIQNLQLILYSFLTSVPHQLTIHSAGLTGFVGSFSDLTLLVEQYHLGNCCSVMHYRNTVHCSKFIQIIDICYFKSEKQLFNFRMTAKQFLVLMMSASWCHVWWLPGWDQIAV